MNNLGVQTPVQRSLIEMLSNICIPPDCPWRVSHNASIVSMFGIADEAPLTDTDLERIRDVFEANAQAIGDDFYVETVTMKVSTGKELGWGRLWSVSHKKYVVLEAVMSKSSSTKKTTP